MPSHIMLLITLVLILPLCKGNRTYEFQSLTATTSIQYFTSTGYPVSYQSNHTSEWLISTDYVNHTVKLQVVDCTVEYEIKQSRCLYEKIFFYDGNSTNGTALTPKDGYCCATVPAYFSSTLSQIYVEFFTDDSTEYKGFNISYFSDGPTTTTQTTTTTTTTTTSTTTTTTTPTTTSVETVTPSSITTTPSTTATTPSTTTTTPSTTATTPSTTTTGATTTTTSSTTVTTLPSTITALTTTATIPSTATTIQSTPTTDTTITTTSSPTTTTPSTTTTTSTITTTTSTTKSGTMTTVATIKTTESSSDKTTTSSTTTNSPTGTNSTTSYTTTNSPTGSNSTTGSTTTNSPTGPSSNENWKYIVAGCVSGLVLLSVIITAFFCYLYYKKVSTVHVQKQRPTSVTGVHPASFEGNQKAILVDTDTSFAPDTGEKNSLSFEQTRNPLFEIDSPVGKANLLPPIESRLV